MSLLIAITIGVLIFFIFKSSPLVAIFLSSLGTGYFSKSPLKGAIFAVAAVFLASVLFYSPLPIAMPNGVTSLFTLSVNTVLTKSWIVLSALSGAIGGFFSRL